MTSTAGLHPRRLLVLSAIAAVVAVTCRASVQGATVLFGGAEATGFRIGFDYSDDSGTGSQLSVQEGTVSVVSPGPASSLSEFSASDTAAAPSLLADYSGAMAGFAQSDVDGGGGSKSAFGTAGFGSLELTLFQNEQTPLLSIHLGSGPPGLGPREPDPVGFAAAGVAGGGGDPLQPVAQSNLIDSGLEFTVGNELMFGSEPVVFGAGFLLGSLSPGIPQFTTLTSSTLDPVTDHTLQVALDVELVADLVELTTLGGADPLFASASATGLRSHITLVLSELDADQAVVSEQTLVATVVVNETSAFLDLTPEPGRALLLVVAAMACLLRRRR